MSPVATNPLTYIGACLLLTYVCGALDRFWRNLNRLYPRTNPKATVNDYRMGQAVTYVPPEAEGNGNHPSCIDGYVSGINYPARIIFFRQRLTNEKVIAATPAQLI